MTLSLFVARLVAVLYLAVALGMFFNKAYYQKLMRTFTHDSASFYLGGFMALSAGFALVTYHNVWQGGWVVLVTLIGWLALFKGIFFFLFPTSVNKATQFWAKDSTWPFGVVVVLGLGLLFGYFGFLAQ